MKHRFGNYSIKMYDKSGIVLRITCPDASARLGSRKYNDAASGRAGEESE